MLIAHGPLGYLTARSTQPYWSPNFTAVQKRWLLALGWIGGMFPDIDLFYFYLVDASLSHRQLITHSVLPYIALVLIGIIWTRVQKNSRVAYGLTVFSLGAVTHVLTDSLFGSTVMFAPFTFELFGLPHIEWIENSFLMKYKLVWSLMLELVIIAALVGVVIRWTKTFFIVAGSILAICFSILLYLHFHTYNADGSFYYADYDNDGTLNLQDYDIDGDGIDNIDDADINGNGESNEFDFYIDTFAADGALYDYSHRGFVEIPLRLGLVTADELVARMYANAGVFFGAEMARDYEVNPGGYIGMPNQNEFGDTVANWQTWLAHTGQLHSADANLFQYDIIFFTSGHVGVYYYEEGEEYLLEAHRSHPLATYIPLEKVIEREGPIASVGKVLKRSNQE